MAEKLRVDYDRYDDSYTELFKSKDDLKEFLDEMKIDVRRKYSVRISVTEIIIIPLSGCDFDIEGVA